MCLLMLGKCWWGCCAWCSLGVAAVVDGDDDVTITSSLGAHGERIDINVTNGEVSHGDFLVHFPIPMREAWNNVMYTCSNMLLFSKV